LVEKLARAMHDAHEKGVLHRDLKPANILLAACSLAESSAKPPAAVPKITDFGLAKQLDDGGRTRTGAGKGTPASMAPQQAHGRPHAVARRTDVSALGAILYECLTGRPPFKAANSLDTILQVGADEPVPPSRLQPMTPRDLETIC